MILYAMKSKKSGRFFQFEQYCDDGYGEYLDNTYYPLNSDSLPTFISNYAVENETDKFHLETIISQCKDHKPEEIEIVKFELEVK